MEGIMEFYGPVEIYYPVAIQDNSVEIHDHDSHIHEGTVTESDIVEIMAPTLDETCYYDTTNLVDIENYISDIRAIDQNDAKKNFKLMGQLPVGNSKLHVGHNRTAFLKCCDTMKITKAGYNMYT